MKHCVHCPGAVGGLSCPGNGTGRLCRLIDPVHPDYRAEYRGAIAATIAELATPSPSLRSIDAVLAEAKVAGIPETIEPRKGCCNG